MLATDRRADRGLDTISKEFINLGTIVESRIRNLPLRGAGMGIKTSPAECQMHCLERLSEPMGRIEEVWQLRNRFKRIVKRRIRYVRNWLFRATYAQNETSALAAQKVAGALQPGDLVRVRSREQIQATLDHWNYLKGTAFMEEMWQYCGTQQRIYKRVEKFLDERDYRVKKVRGMVFLEGNICQGTIDFGPCDRSCFFFWREEWLEKI
jgi:hypothetical protein